MLELLHRYGLNPIMPGDIMFAIERDDCTMVKYLHDKYATGRPDGTQIHWGSVMTKSMACTLVSLGYMPNEKSIIGSAICDHLHVLQYMIDELHVPVPSSVYPAIAMYYPDLSILDYLFSKDASVSSRGSALLAAPYYSRYFSNIGANINAVDGHGRTLLFEAYESVYENTRPADEPGVHKDRALAALVPILLASGIDPEIVDDRGFKARDYANPSITSVSDDVEIQGLF